MYSDVDILLPVLGPDRIARYISVAGGEEAAVELYARNAELGAALFRDIGLVEVALRNAMSSQLNAVFGSRWFARAELFDPDARKLITRGWADGRVSLVDVKLQEGKLIAGLSFGFWTSIMSRGSHESLPEPFDETRTNDEILWKPCLAAAFPNSSSIRTQVLRTANEVRHLRNRVVHHEPVLWGIPLPDQRDKATGAWRRLSVQDAHRSVVRLAGFIDADFAHWLRTQSGVPGLLGEHPEP